MATRELPAETPGAVANGRVPQDLRFPAHLGAHAISRQEVAAAVVDEAAQATDATSGASRRLRAEAGSGTPALVAITGYGQSADKLRAATAGFTEHLVKPVDLNTVLDVVGRLMRDARPDP